MLVDDRDAVKEARARGLTVLGTLALLDGAASRGLIADLPTTLMRLVQKTNFRRSPITDTILREMLARDSERNSSGDSAQAPEA